MVREPHPEETIEAPELGSLRSAAEQSKLLPERQVLEREVGAGSERRAQGAQQSEYEGHWPHGSHAACPSSSLGREFWQTTAGGLTGLPIPVSLSELTDLWGKYG